MITAVVCRWVSSEGHTISRAVDKEARNKTHPLPLYLIIFLPLGLTPIPSSSTRFLISS